MKAQGLTKETILNYGKVERTFPSFGVGDTIAVMLKVKEGEKERVQKFEGVVIAIHRNGVASTFTVRALCANNVGVERILPFASPLIQEIKVVRLGMVRRAKLYYLRDRVGRKAQVKEKVLTKAEKQLRAAKEAERLKNIVAAA